MQGKKILTRFTTNATLLSEHMSRKIILSGLDSIEFSVDSPNPKTFEKIREGTKLSNVINNITRFVRMKDELHSDKPLMRVKVIVSKENVREIPQLLHLLKSIGIRDVLLRELMGDESKKVPEDQQSLLLAYKNYGASLGLNVKLAFPNLPPLNKRKKIKCWKLWKAMYITVDGQITPCCFFPFDKTLTYGNILEGDVKDIWNNREYKYSRKRLRNDLPDYPCKVCIWTA